MARKALSKPEKCSSKGAWCVPSAVGEKNFGRAGSGFSELGSAMPLCWMQEKGTDMLHMLYGSLPMCWLCLCTCCWSRITILKGGVKSVFTSGAFFHHTRLSIVNKNLSVTLNVMYIITIVMKRRIRLYMLYCLMCPLRKETGAQWRNKVSPSPGLISVNVL